MADTLISPSGVLLQRVGRHRTTPTEQKEAQRIGLQNRQAARRAENEALLNNANVRAFLYMTSRAEGGNYHARYGWVAGHNEWAFTDESTHPGAGYDGRTTAAGNYQINRQGWTEHGIRAQGLTDFSPHTQDLIAVEALRFRHGLDEVLSGNLQAAINKVKQNEWVAYQVKPFALCKSWFIEAGGSAQ